MPTRREALGLVARAALGAGLLLPGAARAHHGWRWTEAGEFELTGTIAEVRLGNPHGIVTLDVEGEAWRVEVGQPWRNHAAGLRDEAFRIGATMTAIGRRSADPAERLMKAEQVIIGNVRYILYPNRA